MKLHNHRLLLLSVVFLMCGVLLKAQNKSAGINLSLWHPVCTQPKDTFQTTYLNLGLISQMNKLRGVGINAISSISSRNVYGIQISGLSNIVGESMKGVQLAGITNVNGNNSSGFMASGLVNIAGNEVNGALISGLANISGYDTRGIALSGLINISGDNSRGIQLAGISNITGGDFQGISTSGLINVTGKSLSGVQMSSLLNVTADKMKGAQIAAIGNVGVYVKGIQMSVLTNIAAVEMSGLQLSSAVNIAYQTKKGIQFAGLTNICLENMHGAQVAIGNYATQVKGAQIGLINLCGGEVKGIQIGLINHSKDTSTVKIGLVNINPTTRIQMLAYGGNTTKMNLAVRFQGNLTYSILGIGSHYLGLNDKFSGALFYRAGIYFPLTKRLQISGDLGYNHIENFKNETDDIPERMYAIQARANLEYRVIRKFGIFASGGYGITRYYDKNRFFEKKPIVEIGVVLF